MLQYHDLVQRILDEGVTKQDRTGVGTKSIFGHQMRFDLGEGFPLLTTKKTWFKGVAVELLWFLKGETNVQYLLDHDVHIWDEWADPETGDLGPVYGAQWRSWPNMTKTDFGGYRYDTYENNPIDQIQNVVDQIRKSPFSRRLIVTAWNPAEVDNMALPPCHTMFQFNVRPGSQGQPLYLDCQLYQRSADVFLGVPFNIASYALLTEMIAQQTGLVPGHFVHTMGDAHLYLNHMDQVQELLSRDPGRYPLPHLQMITAPSIDEYQYDNIHLIGYDSYPAIKAEVAV